MYNEEEVIPLFVERLRPVLDGLREGHDPVGYEVVCVDDGSRDKTAQLLLDAATTWPELRLVRLLRNAGHQAALTAGYDTAEGDYVITIDADLQDPPETIAEMLAVATGAGGGEPVDVVYGVRGDRSKDSFFKRHTAGFYYALMRRESGPQMPSNAGDYRLVSRRVVEALRALPDHSRVYRLVIPWFGFPSATVSFVRDERAAGESKYPIRKMVALAIDSISAFSALPLRFATWAGLVGTGVSMFAMLWSVYGLVSGKSVPGWTSILATVGLIGAIQLICLGLLGEYVARMYIASQNRPSYLVGYDSRRDPSAATPGDDPAARG